MNKTHIVIHHSLTKDSQTVSWPAIRDYHMRVNGWRDIGYNWGVELVNGTYVIQPGRPMDEDGAHCKDWGMNQKGIGICLVGNFDAEVPTLEALDTLAGLVENLRNVHHIPIENVIGHREAQERAGLPLELRKTCPGKLFDMTRFRAMLAGVA